MYIKHPILLEKATGPFLYFPPEKHRFLVAKPYVSRQGNIQFGQRKRKKHSNSYPFSSQRFMESVEQRTHFSLLPISTALNTRSISLNPLLLMIIPPIILHLLISRRQLGTTKSKNFVFRLSLLPPFAIFANRKVAT